MGANDAAEMLVAAQAECARLERVLQAHGFTPEGNPAFGADGRPIVPAATGHTIVWKLENDYVTQIAVCNDDDCLSRYGCDHDCEVLYDIRRDDTGVSHGLYGHDDEIKLHLRHDMTKGSYCNVVEFLNAEPSMIPELHEDSTTFEIGRTRIDPVWHGEDGVTWQHRNAGTSALAEVTL
jgi:hypothetical protein